MAGLKRHQYGQQLGLYSRMSNIHILLRGTGILLFTFAMTGLSSLTVGADLSDSMRVHYLPDAHSLSVQPSKAGEDFRLHEFQARNTAGEILNVSAFLLDIPSGAGGWISPEPSGVPPFPETLPTVMRNRVQLIYNGNNSDDAVGWLVVPRGWILWTAGIGADGSTRIEFRAPGDRYAGWMALGEEGGCEGCMPEVVAGLGIRAAAHTFTGNTFFPLNAKLSPKPNVLVHPDACTALITYQTGNLIVHGAIILYTREKGGADGTDSLYIGLPDHENDLGKFIVKAFLDSHTKLPYGYRCESDIAR